MTAQFKRLFVYSVMLVFISSVYTYWHGYNKGVHDVVDNTDKVCSAWWFNGDQRRINQAKMWMCRK